MAGGALFRANRPRGGDWVCTSAIAGALGACAMPSSPISCFVSAGFVGLAQGLLFRHWLAWWSWTLVTLIAGGAAMAMAWVLAELEVDRAGLLYPAAWMQAVVLNAAAGALIGACQAFLLSNEYRGAAVWPATSAMGAALFWTGAALVLLPLQDHWPSGEDWRSRLVAGASMGLSWGGLATVTLLSLRKLKALHRNEVR
jgi:hypothetical protein